MIKSDIFPTIYNKKNYLVSEIPNYHPDSAKYLSWWRTQKKRIFEGCWIPDTKEINIDLFNELDYNDLVNNKNINHSWRWIPPGLYFYINFGTILHKPEDAPRTAPKQKITPYLSDFELAFAYNWIEARGFSGFEDDDEYSCNEDLILIMDKPDLKLHISCYNKNGEPKKYIPTREYLRRLSNKPLGRHLYYNQAKNLMLLGSRGGGKSWLSAIYVLLHEIITDGSKYYTEKALKDPPLNEIFLGSGIASKSADLAAKIKIGMDNLPGMWRKGTTEQKPSPLFKHMAGTLAPNNIKNPWRHEYEKKIGGEYVKVGSGSNIKHGVFTTENPEATAGGRYSVIVIEECGLTSNLLTVHGSSEATQMTDGTDKYGSSLYIGCVCEGTKVWTNDGRLVPIEALTQEDGIVGYHSKGYLPQAIEKFTEPVEKPCYKINLEGGDSIECSEDHPILISKSKFDKNINWEKYKKCTFRETKNIVAGDQVGMITSVPIFGNKKEENARLLGLLVGDGYIGKSTTELSVDSDEVNEFLINNYTTTLKKEFLTKSGYWYRSYSIKGISNLIKESGLYNKTKDKKTLPTNIDSYDKESLAEFIGGYFDANGSVKIGANGATQVILTSNIKTLLEGIKYRLTKFGIESNIYLEKRRTGYKGGSENKYVLYINSSESVVKFANNIKFLTKRKQEKLNKIYTQTINKNYRTSNKLLYVGGDDGNFFEGASIVEEIKFKRVNSVEFIGNKLVYNLTAGGTHSYIANNIITHNTGGNIEKIVESEIIFRDPEGFNMLSFEDEWENTGKICWFVPAPYMDRRYKDSEGNTLIEEAYKNYTDRRIQKKKAKSSSALDLEMMNYPLIPSEMFLNKTKNNYPTADLKHRLAELSTNPKILNSTWKGEFIINSDGKIEWKTVDKAPIREFPLKASNTTNIEGCPEMFYPPQKDENGDIASGRYIAACLLPGEKVITDKGLKPIESVIEGDKLINQDGVEVDIIKFIKINVENEDSYEVKVANTLRTTTFTKEHPILASKDTKGYLSYNKSKRLNINQRFKKFDFKYKPVSELTTDDWIKVPNIYKNLNNFDINTLWNSSLYRVDRQIRSPLSDKDFWWFIGLFLGDGWTQGKYKISVSFNEKETQYIDKFTNIVNKLFNRAVSYKTGNGSTTATFCSVELVSFLNTHFGKYALDKKLPEWAKKISPDLKLNLLLGYLDSDGCITLNKNKDYISTEFVSINLELLEGIQDILFSLGIISSITLLREESKIKFKINNIESSTFKTYHLRISHRESLILINKFKAPDDLKIRKIDLEKILITNTQKQTIGCFFSEDLSYIYFKVDSIKKSVYSGTVYNFECITNTFMCHHITTHNCDPVDDDDNQDVTTSLQSFLIFDTFFDRIVFEYTGRTRYAKDFYEQCRRALIYYNAKLLYENQKKGVFTYFDQKNSTYLMEDTPEALRDIDMQKISKTGNKSKGIYATPAINKWGREDLAPAWMSQQALNKPEGVTNAMTLKSPALIREAVLYNPNLNTDRISALGILMIFREIKAKFIEASRNNVKVITPDADPFWNRSYGRKAIAY